MSNLLKTVRGLVRPIVTVGGFGSAVVMIFGGVAIPDWYQALIVASVSFWFGSRVSKGSDE